MTNSPKTAKNLCPNLVNFTDQVFFVTKIYKLHRGDLLSN